MAVHAQRPLKKTDDKLGNCVACFIADAHKAALDMLHSGYPKTVSSGCPTLFEQTIRVNCSATKSDSSFEEKDVWTAPFVYDDATKEGSHFGVVCHMPLLIANLRSVTVDNCVRLLPPGYKYEDKLLVRQSANDAQPQLPMSFFS